MGRIAFPLFTLALIGAACGSALGAGQRSDPRPASEPSSQLVLLANIEWGPLNPARGEQGPKAGDLWGDRSAAGPSGFLVEFAEGFSSPPHIHNVTYRGVVIRGLVHNDDPNATEMWMPPGSFWTQPAGEVHITAANAASNLAYIEIERGPYLVLPTTEASDEGERPVNVDPSNLVWLDASTLTWIEGAEHSTTAAGPKVAFLWGSPEEDRQSGALLELPAGFSGALHGHGSSLRAVLIRGRFEIRLSDSAEGVTAEPGSYFGSRGEAIHEVTCEGSKKCILYVRAKGTFDLVPALARKR